MSRFIIQTLLSLITLLIFQSCDDEISRPGEISCRFNDSSFYRQNARSSDYQALIDRYVQRGLPGISLLIKDSTGFFVGSSGLADIRNKIPMKACQSSKIASITKMMLGVAVLRLQEKGLLSLNDPIDKYISSQILRKISNGDKPITIRNLMNHTSGFYDVIEDQGFYLQVLNDPARHWTADDLLEYVYHKPAMFAFSPMDTAGYSNTNYLLLSMVIESATGLPHSAVLHNEVIDPLGLEDTYYFYHDPLPGSGIAQGYYDLYNNGNLENLTQWNTGSGNGYGGVYSTVWDMYKFIDALFVQKTILSQASLDQMLVFSPVIESHKLLGLSCFKDFIDIGDPDRDYAWGHRGRDLSYSADLFYFPGHNAVMALMVNYGTDGDSPLKPVYLSLRDDLAGMITGNQ